MPSISKWNNGLCLSSHSHTAFRVAFSAETRFENKSDTNKFKINSINKRNRDCR